MRYSMHNRGGASLSAALAVSRGSLKPEFPRLRSKIRGLWAPLLGMTGTRIPDLSGYGNHGTVVGCPWGVSIHGPVVTGTNNGSQRIALDRRITVNSRNFTVWAMVYTSGASCLFMTQSDISRYALYQTTGVLQCAADGIEGANFAQVANQWSQIGLTVDSVGGVTYYSQGTLGAVDSGLTGDFNFDFIMNTASQDFAIDGKLGAIAIFERKLGSDEMSMLFNDWSSLVAPKLTFPTPLKASVSGIANRLAFFSNYMRLLS